jgi:ABC-type phosphate/phosphonate transport system substrate-binding protein
MGEISMRSAFPGLCGVVLLGLLQFPVPAWAGDESLKVGLTWTIFPGQSGKKLEKAARPFRSLLEDSTGFKGQMVLGGEARSLADKLKAGEVQLGVFQGIEFAWARISNPKLEPVVLCVNGPRTVRAYLLVRAASKFKKPADLRGKTLARAEETRAHCNVFLRRKAIPEDSTPKKFFRKIKTTKDAEEALDELVDGTVQAALVDGLAWSEYRKVKSGAARKLRVLLSSEPFPCGMIACQSGHFSAAQMKRLRDGLLAARDGKRGRQLLQQLRMTGFKTVTDDYERLLTSIVKTYPPPPKK